MRNVKRVLASLLIVCLMCVTSGNEVLAKSLDPAMRSSAIYQAGQEMGGAETERM